MSLTRRLQALAAVALLIAAATPTADASHGTTLTLTITDPDTDRDAAIVGPAETAVTKKVNVANPSGGPTIDKLVISASGTGDDDLTFTAVSGSCQVATGWTATLGGSGATVSFSGSTLLPSTSVELTLCFNVVGAPANAATIAIAASGEVATVEHTTGAASLTVDAAPPTITEAETSDTNSNGRIDKVTVLLGEKVKASSVDSGDWELAGITGEAATLHADKNKIVITFLEGDTPDTGTKPDLDYEVGGDLEDLYGNKATTADTSITMKDKAAPVLMRATAELGTKDVTLTFSENVEGSGTGGVIVKADLTYTDGGGEVQTISSVTHTAETATAVVTLDKVLTTADIGSDDDTIAPTTAVVDDANNPAVTTARIIDEVTDPAPGPVTSLAVKASATTTSSLTFEWVTPTATDLKSFDARRSLTDITTAAQFNAATSLSGEPTPSSGATQSMVLTGLSQNTKYYFAIRVIDNADQQSTFVATSATTAIDTTPPIGDLALTSTSHTNNTASTVDDVVLTWSAATDAESATVNYYYTFGKKADQAVDADDNKTTGLTAEFADQAPGTYYFHLRAGSAGGLNATTYHFIVVIEAPATEDPEDPVLAYQKKFAATVVVKYTKDGNEITWQVPAGAPSEIAGVQVLVRNSPYQLVAPFTKDDQQFKDRFFLHNTASALKTSAYTVLPFFNYTIEGGYYGTANAGQVSTTDFPGVLVPADERLPLWGWVLIVLGAITVIALIMATILATTRRRRDDYEEPWEGDDVGWTEDDYDAPGEWDREEAPAPSEPPQTFNMECPACHTVFSEAGVRPLTTTCPGCGKKGVLH